VKLKSKLAVVAGTLVLGATPALAIADQPADPGSNGHASKAKAYGKSCRGESKKHVKGEKGTAFSRCVTAKAKAAHAS